MYKVNLRSESLFEGSIKICFRTKKKICVCNRAKVKKNDRSISKQIEHFGGERNHIKKGDSAFESVVFCHGTNRLGPSISKHNIRNQVQHHIVQ